MLKILGAIYILVAPTIMGILIVALLTMNMFESSKIALAAAAGAVIALPVAWFVSKHILALTKGA
ncbi:hypothetical protein CSC94_09305 [Zhengella mangrovi]|uniref:CTP synthetase n=1 Tax=Zhengella mangrovi TaxID=1982044 RepID=A0A2G1QNZ7_9HYPH|nr:hypothetical protein [Zhengella mangrovi]PHP67232.1 hypothetical protein CSC94_09305 [Zhengella mangrovi]